MSKTIPDFRETSIDLTCVLCPCPEEHSEEDFSFWGTCFSNQYRMRANRFGALASSSRWVVQNAFYVSRGGLCGHTVAFEKIIKLISIVEDQPGTFGLFAKEFWQGFNTAVQVSQRKLWGKIILWETQTFLFIFWLWMRSFGTYGRSLLTG